MTPEERARVSVQDWPLRHQIQPWLLDDLWQRIEGAIHAAIAEEREAIAHWYEREYDPSGRDAPQVARAIRARPLTPQ